MLSSKQIVELAVSEPRAGLSGKVEAMRRMGHMNRPGGARLVNESIPSSLSPQEENFLGDVSGRPVNVRVTYSHPGLQAGAVAGESTSLTPADLVWLQRLPSDPAQVSYSDAVRLGGLVASIDRVKSKSDARLVKDIYAPVKALHDRKAAEAELANARLPLPTVPTPALNVLAEALRRETPALQESEAASRANQQLREAADAQASERAQRIGFAEAHLAQVEAAEANRTAVERPE